MAAERVLSRRSPLPPRARLGARRRRRGAARRSPGSPLDSLGELVHFEPPAVGQAARRRTRSYGEVESVKAVSELVAPLSGEVLEVNAAASLDAARDRERRPLRRRLAVRIALARPGRGRRAARRRRPTASCSRDPVSYTLADRRRPRAMLAAIGVASVEELFRDIPAGVASRGELDVPPALAEAELTPRTSSELAAKQRARRASRSSAPGIYDHYVPAVVDAVLARGEFLTAYTPYQPELSQGILQAIFEYQTAICELTGMDVSNASGYDGTTVAADACFLAKHGDRGARKVVITEATNPQVRAGRQDLRPRLRARGRRGPPRRRRRPIPSAVREAAARRGRGDLPAAELLRLPRARARARRGRERCRRAPGRPRRPDQPRRARGARQLRLRARDRRGPVGRQLHELRRAALRLPRRHGALHAAAAGTDRRRDGRRRRRARLRAHAADARAAHPAREGDLEHHHQPDAARARRARPPLAARPAGAARDGRDVHGARRQYAKRRGSQARGLELLFPDKPTFKEFALDAGGETPPRRPRGARARRQPRLPARRATTPGSPAGCSSR